MYKFKYDGQQYLCSWFRYTKEGMEMHNVRIYNEMENQYRFHSDKLEAYVQQIHELEFVKGHGRK